MSQFDRRLTPARQDLAALHLKGRVEAARFVEPSPMRVAAASASVRREPRSTAALDTEALHGEEVAVYEIDGEGWAWGQLASDGYVGYLPADDLCSCTGELTHVVRAPYTFLYPGPDIKLPPLGSVPLGGRVHVVREEGAFSATPRGFVFSAHVVPVGSTVPDFVTIAEHFVGVPYLWGGRTHHGLDCSALVQLSLTAGGVACPRDTDLQLAEVGTAVSTDSSLSGLARGDLVFWRGHVGLMLDAERLIHANAFHMMVEIEPLAAAVARIEAGGGPITGVKRVKL